MKLIRKRLNKINVSECKQNILSENDLIKKLKSLLVSNCLDDKLDFYMLNDEIQQKKLEYSLLKPVNKIYLSFIIYVSDVINRVYDLKNSKYVDLWEEAYVIYVNNKKDYSLSHHLFQTENLLVNSILYFKKYRIKTHVGKVVIDNTIKQISNEINKNIIKIGPENVLSNIFEEQIKRNRYKRFHMPKKVTMGGFPELGIPFNYLINLSVKNITKNITKKNAYEKKDLEHLYTISKQYLALFQVQDYDVLSHMSLGNFTLENLYRQLSYDNIFRFNQISDDNILKILNNLFLNINYDEMKKKLGFSLEEYISLLKRVIALSPKEGPIYLLFNLFSDHELKILNLISHHQKINTKFILPTDVKMITFNDKPLIKLIDSFLLIDLNYCSWIFYEVLLELLSTNNVSVTRKNANRINSNIGFNIEDFLIKELENKKINIHYGRYSEKNECDIVVEDKKSNALVFLEIKKKNFTKESRSGDLNFVALDLVESFVYAMNQTYRHEHYLRKNGKIKFINGTNSEIIYNNQKIERVAVTLYDFQSLTQNSMALIEWFSELIFIIDKSFTPNTYQEKRILKQFKKANKQLDLLRTNIKLMSKEKEEYRSKRMNSKLVSLEYILFLLEYIDDEKSLYDMLVFNKPIFYGSGDLYAEFLSYYKLRAKKE
ncbi:hypothetical protein [Arcobacter sp. F2176]|uniref:hypothetical protein n=1 Tax=Arcobacter sp. F2176 TaxID=2044511 RepID=UPI00100C0020|nr:hypothetical protein [Arcobacter sp. F2176]RXJ79331.1 hypothetical protein CRU95_14430 [Arcobacter sp. F2176]